MTTPQGEYQLPKMCRFPGTTEDTSALDVIQHP